MLDPGNKCQQLYYVFLIRKKKTFRVLCNSSCVCNITLTGAYNTVDMWFYLQYYYTTTAIEFRHDGVIRKCETVPRCNRHGCARQCDNICPRNILWYNEIFFYGNCFAERKTVWIRIVARATVFFRDGRETALIKTKTNRKRKRVEDGNVAAALRRVVIKILLISYRIMLW